MGADEKIAIKLREGEKYGALIETKEDGTEHTYYPNKFGIHWTCEKLQVRQVFARREENDPSPPKMLTYVSGIARLDSDRDISVIGEPTNKTATVRLSLRPEDSPDLLTKVTSESDEKPVLELSQPYGRVHLGFTRRNQRGQGRLIQTATSSHASVMPKTAAYFDTPRAEAR